MNTKIGVGYSENTDSKQAGIEAAKMAMLEAGTENCNLAILYATSKQDPNLLHEGVRSVIGQDSRLIGGFAMGIITKNFLAYEGYQVGLLVMETDSIDIDMYIEKGLVDNEYNIGISLAKSIISKEYAGEPNVLLMYDSIKEKISEGLSLNMATPILQGMKTVFVEWPRMAGVGLMGDMKWEYTYQWFDNMIEQKTAMALVLSGNIRMDTIIMHGCKPVSDYFTITNAENNIVKELDNRPAAEVAAEFLGLEDYDSDDFLLFTILGVNKGDKYGQFNDEDYASRLCMGTDKERKGLVMFENDLKTGDEVQLMQKSVEVEYIGQRAEELLGRIRDRKPIFAMYINCAGRTKLLSGTVREGAEEIQRVIGSKMPFLGMYSGVEIAKVGKDMQALDWTGVLCVFSEE